MTSQCIIFIRYLSKNMWALEQELENTMSPISTPVNARTPESLLRLCVSRHLHAQFQDLETTIRLHSLPRGILLSMMSHPLSKHSKRCQRKDLLCTHQHEIWAYRRLFCSARNKKEGADGNHAGLSNYDESSWYMGPNPPCPFIYTGNLTGVICNKHSVKWTWKSLIPESIWSNQIHYFHTQLREVTQHFISFH